MAIRIKNISPKSALHFYDLNFQGSAASNTTGFNAGVLPYASRLEDVIVGNTASALGLGISLKVNGVTQGAVISISALTVSGGTLRQPAPASPVLITAGSLISVDLSATAGTTIFYGTLRFKIAEHAGK